MYNPTIFVSIDSREENNPIQNVLIHVTKAFGCAPMEKVVQGEMEADIAVTNSVATALRLVKETEKTSIVIMYLRHAERAEADALASRFSGRIIAQPVCNVNNEEMSIVPFLLKLMGQKMKEKEVKS